VFRDTGVSSDKTVTVNVPESIDKSVSPAEGDEAADAAECGDQPPASDAGQSALDIGLQQPASSQPGND